MVIDDEGFCRLLDLDTAEERSDLWLPEGDFIPVCKPRALDSRPMKVAVFLGVFFVMGIGAVLGATLLAFDLVLAKINGEQIMSENNMILWILSLKTNNS